MEKVLVFGHKNPDTDSVAGAIALAYLKNINKKKIQKFFLLKESNKIKGDINKKLIEPKNEEILSKQNGNKSYWKKFSIISKIDVLG